MNRGNNRLHTGLHHHHVAGNESAVALNDADVSWLTSV
jgi:hypothetical protein